MFIYSLKETSLVRCRSILFSDDIIEIRQSNIVASGTKDADVIASPAHENRLVPAVTIDTRTARCRRSPKTTGGKEGVIVHILPAAVDLPVRPGQSLLEAALSRGYLWRSICGGHAQCGACAVEVTEGALPVSNPLEEDMLARLIVKARHGGTMRLACQLKPDSPLIVINPAVRAQR